MRYGYHGKFLLVDLSTGSAESRPLPQAILRSYLGGVGLGTWLLAEHAPPNHDPLSPAAPLVVAFSPLVGSPLTTSAKFAVVTKSPLTDRINDSLCSSRFALSGKRTGFDALVIIGQCNRPCVLVIENGSVRFDDAGDLWGRSIPAASRMLEIAYGAHRDHLSIGPAGERLVRFATISHDGRHAGRGGAGAVMGAKKLKAIVVSGNRSTRFAHPQELGTVAKRLSVASLGKATAKYRELGTVSNLLTLNRLSSLPTRNFRQTHFALAESLSRSEFAQSSQVVRKSCASCGIGCEHIFASSRAGRSADEGVRLEYENVYALGPLCGVSDPGAVARSSQRCDALGLDTISAGATIALAMECAENGWLRSVRWRFGSSAAVMEAIEMIASRTGCGDALAEGTRRWASTLGPFAERIAPHVKGLELPGYDPRTMQTLAVGLAVNARGADHNRSGAYQRDLMPGVDRFRISADTPRHVMECEDESTLLDSLILCKFVRRALGDNAREQMANMVRLTVGWEIDAAELGSVARRTADLRHWFNLQAGWSAAEDTLPERLFEEPAVLADDTVVRLDRSAFSQAVQRYYQLRGWSETGQLPREAVSDLRVTIAETKSDQLNVEHATQETKK